MSMTLTSGRESRMDGAPPLPDPEKEARTRAVAIHLLEQIGEPVTEESLRAIMPDAERMAEQYSTPQFEAAAIEANRAGMDAAVARGDANAANRASQRQSARGVVPEDLPPGEFGVATGRTVQEANRPMDEAEAALELEQDAADRLTRGLREGRRNWDAEGEYQYLQERGEQNPLASQGSRDVDLRRKIMQRRGQFFETADGNVIPVGRAPTAADLRNEREWEGWVNETPGSERQARYAPEAYEAWQEQRAQNIQQQGREELEKYGRGPDDPEARRDLGLAPLSADQVAAREARRRSNKRLREGQRGKFYAQRLQNDTGMPAGTPIEVMEAERFRLRDKANKDDKAARKRAVADRGKLRGQGLPYAMAELSEEDRADAIRGLIPNRNAEAGIEGAELGLKRDDLEARREADRQRFEAMMQKMELEAQEARQRADEARMRWEEEQRVARERFDEETRRYREGRESAEEARRLEAEERQKDRDARAKERADDDARARAMPQLEAGARAQVDENKQEMEQRAAERAEQAALRNAQLMNDQRLYGDGVLHIMAGNYDTPEARKSLQAMARASDNSWFGYYQSDAESFDGTLARLGVNDPATRHALVQRYGLSISEGRGGWGSSLYNLLAGVDFPQR